MAQDARGEVYDLLAARGVSRRDFMKYCGSVAALLGLSEMYAPQIAAAVESGAKLKPVLWIAQGLCTGCTESMAQSRTPDVPTIVLDILSVNYWETVMASAGADALKAITDTVDKGGYILVVEGSIMNGANGNTLRVGGRPGRLDVKEAAAKADAVIAVGSCAVDGGWVKAAPNPADATGVTEYLAAEGIKTPVINLPTCPVNPEWVVAMVVDVLLIGKLPVLDDKGRPTLIYGSTIHDNCPRRGHFENGEFVEKFGTVEEKKQFCLYKVGCKGPQTYTNCPYVRWNDRVSWCVESGSPCIGCGNFNWVDNDAPFLQRMTNVNLPGIGGVAPSTVGAVLGGTVAAALIVHGVVSGMTGRVGKGGPPETEKAYDRKKAAKGGDN
jgi:hydrogenase small subunit